MAFGISTAALAFFGGAIIDRLPAQVVRGDNPAAAQRETAGSPDTGAAVIQIAAVTQQVAALAGNAAIVAPPVAAPAELAAAAPAPDADTAAPERPLAVAPPAAQRTAAQRTAAHRIAERGAADARADARARRRHLAAADDAAPAVRSAGRAETGTAAWYGGRYVGRRTTSGERLDTVHPTAAHRTLPLNSLVRVTNLHNGRSVICRITDRGPVSPSLLIDMSPRAAEELAMKKAGLVPVKVEPVIALAADDR
ncbi:MAG TPA: septal ring lytic transglycosylase RlpA family protein [Stellaceae bacterium]|nr:septal ring lytic transglycosylase RlpA family protein [Stellaceae bacterium]